MRTGPDSYLPLKNLHGCLLPILTKIVNTSLAEANVPAVYKEAVLRPLLKKPGLEADDLKTIALFEICLLSQRSWKRLVKLGLNNTLKQIHYLIKCSQHIVSAIRQKQSYFVSTMIWQRHSIAIVVRYLLRSIYQLHSILSTIQF